MKCKHIVTYVGNGVHIDSNGDSWTTGKSREYETEGSKEQFLEDRKDLQFMFQYGTMHISSMSMDTKAPQAKSEIKDNAKSGATNTSKTEAQDTKEENEVKIVKAK